MSDWQPIETAPRDGTMILCYHPKYGMILPGVWDGGDQNAFELKDERLEYVKDFYPTHWMPLPPLPEARRAKHGVTIPRPIAATHNPDGDSLVLTFRNDEDLEIAMKELGCEPR